MRMKLVDAGYVLKVVEAKDWYVYVIEGKNSAYRVWSKKFYDVDTFVFVYSDDERFFVSDK